MRARIGAGALAIAGVLALCLTTPSPAAARTLDYWVAAVPTSWSIVPNGHDAIEHYGLGASGSPIQDLRRGR